MNQSITLGETVLVTLFTFVCIVGYVFVKTVIQHQKSK
jgi:hypothetical protein